MKETVGRLILALLHLLVAFKLYLDRVWLQVRRRMPLPNTWSKIPVHVLIVANDEARLSIPPSLIKYLQSVVGVQSVSIQANLISNLKFTHQNYQPIIFEDAFPLNRVTEDGLMTMCRAIEGIKRKKGDLSEDAITQAITKLPPIDLIIIFDEELTVKGCCPWLIGFAEICHLPRMPIDQTSMQMALEQFSRCQQRFGK